jgi:hypothetical protein
LKGTCWEQRKTTSDSALKISGFRVSPGFSADAAWWILRRMLKAELPGWKMHNWWWERVGFGSTDAWERYRNWVHFGFLKGIGIWGIFAVSGLLPWSAVCCYFTGHKQCKHQHFQWPGSQWIHAECDNREVLEIAVLEIACSCNFVICTVKSIHILREVVKLFPSIHPSRHLSMDGIIQGRKPWQK